MFIHSDRPDVKIYIVNKGKDVQASKDLSKELGIDSCIEWFEPVALSMLTDMYRKADICIDQCGTHWGWRIWLFWHAAWQTIDR